MSLTEEDPWVDQDEAVLAEARALAARRFEALGAGGHPVQWWGLLVGLASVATVLGGLIYAWGYLWISNPEWPPAGFEPPALGLSIVGLVLVGGALVAHAPWWRRNVVMLAGGAGLGVAFIVVQVLDMVRSGLEFDQHAYAAIVLTMQCAALVVAAAAVSVSVAAVWSRISNLYTDVRREHSALAAATLWLFVAVHWGAIWAVIYLGARVL